MYKELTQLLKESTEAVQHTTGLLRSARMQLEKLATEVDRLKGERADLYSDPVIRERMDFLAQEEFERATGEGRR